MKNTMIFSLAYLITAPFYLIVWLLTALVYLLAIPAIFSSNVIEEVEKIRDKLCH